MRLCKTIIRNFLAFLYAISQFAKLIKNLKEYLHGESYFPEYAERRKSSIRVFLDQLCQIIRYGDCNNFYYLYGFDIKGLGSNKEYVDNCEFVRARERLNNKSNEYSMKTVLRDKSLFSIFCNSYNVSTPINIGLYENGKYYCYRRQAYYELKCLAEKTNDVFFKSIDGECGEGILHVVTCDSNFKVNNRNISDIELIEILGDGRYIIQERINQHEKLSVLHCQSINTVRLVTVYNQVTKEVCIMSAVLRVGVGNSNVDNWAHGGLSIGIDCVQGTLKEYGFYKPGFGTKTTQHPDSNIIFQGYELPFIDEAIREAMRLHLLLKDIHSIGWDIALTNNGPCFIEGNDNWELSLMQICNGGQRGIFEKIFKN